MKLYEAPFAPNPRRVRWVMAEKGVDDVELVRVDIMQGEHKGAAYLEKAGMPVVPALELDDGTVVTESVAICRYLESRHPEPNLFGRTPEETAVIEMWLRRVEFLIATPFMMWVRHASPPLKALEDQDPMLARHYEDQAMKGLTILEARLAGRSWIAADRLTIADIVAFIGVDFARLIRFRPPEALAEVKRWAEAMRERPAAQAGMG